MNWRDSGVWADSRGVSHGTVCPSLCLIRAMLDVRRLLIEKLCVLEGLNWGVADTCVDMTEKVKEVARHPDCVGDARVDSHGF